MEKRDFKDVLSSLMDEKNFNPSSLGREIGVAYQTIQKYLAGTAKPKTETKAKLAEALGVSVAYLETGVEPIAGRIGILLDATTMGTSEFGFVLGVPKTRVADWLEGRPPTDDELMDMAQVFDVSYAWLRSGAGTFAPELHPAMKYWSERGAAFGDGDRPNEVWIDDHAAARIEVLRQRLALQRAEFAVRCGMEAGALPEPTATVSGRGGDVVRNHIEAARKVAEKLKVNLPWITLGAGLSGMDEFDLVRERQEYDERAMIEGQDRLLAALARMGFRFNRPVIVPMAPPNEDLTLLLEPHAADTPTDAHLERALDAVRKEGGKVLTPFARKGAGAALIAAEDAAPAAAIPDRVIELLYSIWSDGDTAARREVRGLLEEINDRIRGGR
jgi:transcriptional regulator with XRE-family HTH domain